MTREEALKVLGRMRWWEHDRDQIRKMMLGWCDDGVLKGDDYHYLMGILDEVKKDHASNKNPERLISVYRGSTDLYTDDEIDEGDTADLYFPEEIVRGYWKEHCDMSEDWRYKEWLHNYTADDTADLYDYAKRKGFTPEREDEDEIRYYEVLTISENKIPVRSSIDLTLQDVIEYAEAWWSPEHRPFQLTQKTKREMIDKFGEVDIDFSIVIS